MSRFKLKLDNPYSEVRMFTGGDQHNLTYVHSQFDTGMTDPEFLRLFNINIETVKSLTEEDILNRIEIK